jgi:hypothetical protein
LAAEQVVAFSLEIFSPKELSEIAAFYATDAGQRFLDRPLSNTRSADTSDAERQDWIDTLTEDQVVEIAGFIENTQGGMALLSRGSEIDAMIDSVIDEMINSLDVQIDEAQSDSASLERIFSLLTREDMVEFDDPAGRARLIEYLNSVLQ